MLRITLTQMRLNAGRLAAAGIAVVLGTAFVGATLLAGDLLKTTMYEAVSASYRGADVVVTGARAAASTLASMRRLPQLDGADTTDPTMVELVAGGRADTTQAFPLASAPALQTVKADSGRLPSANGEIAVTADLAERLRLSIGSQLTARTLSWPAGTGQPVPHQSQVGVVAILAPTTGFGLRPDVVATAADVTRWSTEQGNDGTLSALVAHAAPGVTPEQASAAVAALPGWGEAKIRTGEQQTLTDLKRLTREVDILTVGLLGFAGVSLFVAGLVIANTFQVLVAQRTRALALLRCVGATRRQIRRSTLLEASLLGVTTSLLGLLLGTGLVNAVAAALSRMDVQVRVPGTVRPSLASILAPLLVGTLVTIGAALSPARAATRVSPVAALRPATAPTLRARGTLVRLVLVTVLMLAGGGLLALGMRMSANGHNGNGVLPALAGGAFSFLGVLVGGSIFIPRLVGLAGRMAGRWGGVPTRIAAANAVRNPRRTATTSTALLIGVTLVATVSTGAAVLSATLNRQLDSKFLVDMVVGFPPVEPSTEPGLSMPPVPGSVAPALEQVTGVADLAILSGGQVRISGATGKPAGTSSGQEPGQEGQVGQGGTPSSAPGEVPSWVTVQGVDPARAANTLHDRVGTAGLTTGSVIVPRKVADPLGVRAGDALRLTASGRTVRLRAVVTDLRWDAVLVTPGDLRTVLPKAGPQTLWLRLDPAADAKDTVNSLQETIVTATGSESSVPVEGVSVERAGYEEAIRTLLFIVTGLLAVAVVIALIGVANTLSLSVIERTRESAVLRALGLTRRQLRAMLAVEGALIAGIGALVGIGLGIVYGWAGAASLISGAWSPALVIPVGNLTLLLVGGVLAGLVASVLPGRRAARTAPVAALAE